MEENSVIILQLIISGLTLILTPLFSALIVNFQLKKNHLYWEKQQNILQDLEIDKLKASTYRESVESTNKLNDKILHHHIYASNRDIFLALSNILKESSPNDSIQYLNQFNIQKTNAENSYLDMREGSILFSGIGVNIRLYFDEEIFKKYSLLQKKFKTAQQNIISVSDLENIALDLISKGTEVNNLKEKLSDIYFEKFDKEKPENQIHQFLDALMIKFKK